MTIRYANSGGSNTSPYDTLAKGATDPQTIIDLAVAGDENRYFGTFTLAATLDFDTNSGDITSGVIKHIGVNGSDVVDGTRVVLDGNSAAGNCILLNVPYHWIENFECKNSTSINIFVNSVGDNAIFINCISYDSAGRGWIIAGAALNCMFLLCQAYSNTGDGFSNESNSRFLYCTSYDNSGQGFDGSSSTIGALFYSCLVHNNTTAGMQNLDSNCIILNCVIDGETTGLSIDDHRCLLIGNRITNNTTGIDFNTKIAMAGWNYFHGNTSDVADATLAYNLPYREELTNALMSAGIDGTNASDVDADDGYNNRANDDFNLKTSRTGRRVEIDLEVGT